MTNHYDSAYWDESLDERVSRAREEYRRAKERLLRRQVDLVDIEPTWTMVVEAAKELTGTAGAFGPPIKSEAVKAVFGTELEKERTWESYLKDFEWYVRKKVEYDRLYAEADRRATFYPDGRPVEMPTGPQYREAPIEVEPGDRWMSEMKDEVEVGLKKVVDLIKGKPEEVDHMPYRVGKTIARRRVKLAMLYATQAQTLGADESLGISDALLECRLLFDRMVDDAKGNFWKGGCTRENFEEWIELAAAVTYLGDVEHRVDLFNGTSAGDKPHTVERGETLRSIAKEHYDNECCWYGIYSFNSKAIGPNPELLTPGLTLVLP